MSRLPIRIRVTAAFALAMAAVLGLTALFLYLRLGSHLSTALDRELRVRAQDLAALAVDPRAPFPDSRFVEHGESYAQLLAPDGRVLKATRPLGGAPLLDVSALRGPTYLDRRSVPGLDEPSRLFASRIGRNVLVVGATRQDRAETLAAFRNELLIAGPIALLLASAAGYLLAGFALRPVESMRRRAAEISADTPGERLPVSETGDELERLGETLNAMLDRLEAALERERGFVADAGHELRTPLAILRTELEVAVRQAGSVDELKEAIGRSAQEVDRLSQLAEDLLLIARSEDGGLAAPDRASRRRPAFRRRRPARRAARAGGGEARDGLARRDGRCREIASGSSRRSSTWSTMRSATAATRSRSPHGGRSCTSPTTGRAFRRGSSTAPSSASRARTRRADASGAGLGLAIVRTIAEAHGGSAHAANRAPGADVWLSLPG